MRSVEARANREVDGLHPSTADSPRPYPGGTAGVPEARAGSLQGLAGRGRGYPRVSSGSDTSGDTIPASGSFIRRKLQC